RDYYRLGSAHSGAHHAAGVGAWLALARWLDRTLTAADVDHARKRPTCASQPAAPRPSADRWQPDDSHAAAELGAFECAMGGEEASNAPHVAAADQSSASRVRDLGRDKYRGAVGRPSCEGS